MKNYKKQLNKLRSLPIIRYDFSLTQLTSLKEGSYFKYQNLLYVVDSISLYKDSSGFTWKELECYSIQNDNVIYIEIEEDDEIEVFITLREVLINHLNKNIEQIESISEKEKGSIVFENTKYEYDDDYAAIWSKNNESYKVYFYDFMSEENPSLYLTIEEWKIDKNQYEYKAYLSKQINQNELSVILN